MHPLKMLFDDINQNHWGISDGKPPTKRRRREPVPRPIAAMLGFSRDLTEKIAVLLRRFSSSSTVLRSGARRTPSRFNPEARLHGARMR